MLGSGRWPGGQGSAAMQPGRRGHNLAYGRSGGVSASPSRPLPESAQGDKIPGGSGDRVPRFWQGARHEKHYRQLVHGLVAPLIREVLSAFRHEDLTALESLQPQTLGP